MGRRSALRNAAEPMSSQPAPVKSVCPVGTGIPDDGAGPGSGMEDQLGARADEAPLLHAPRHPIRIRAHLPVSVVGPWVPAASRRSSDIQSPARTRPWHRDALTMK